MKRGYAVALGALALSWWPVTEIAAQVGEAPRPAKKRSIMMAKAEPATIILEAQQPEEGPKPAPKPRPVESAVIESRPAEVVYEPAVMPCEPCCPPRCGVTAGAGFLLVQPHWDSNPALVTSFAPVGITGLVPRATTEFDWGTNFAPLLWLGFQGDDGLGIRGRYMGLRASAETSVINSAAGTIINTPLGQIFEEFPFNPPVAAIGSATVGDAIVVANDLDLDVFDLEATQDFRVGRWSLLFAGGLRYAEAGQGYNAVLVNTTTPRTSADDYSNRFTGFGPTVGLEARRPLGYGLNLYGSMRVSVLFGTSRHRVTNFDQRAGELTLIDIAASREEVLPVTEVEVGTEWATPVGDNARLFLRTALVGHVWHGLGSASAAVANDTSDLGLYGLSLAVGLDR